MVFLKEKKELESSWRLNTSWLPKIAKGHLKKLDDQRKKVVYLGTKKGSKAYRLLDPNTGGIYVSREVIFEENRRWEWEKSLRIK